MSLSRREFLRTTGVGALAYTIGQPRRTAAQAAQSRPNVLFIAVDDLNHWIEPLGGHPQAHTPNLTRLASRSVNFRHAYCASPSCLPARTALLTGEAPYNTGVYTNYQYWREALPDVVTLPQYFKANGYYVAGAGKIFHNDQPDTRAWEAYFPSLEHPMPGDPRPPGERPVNMTSFPNMYTAFDWAPLDVADDEMGDSKSVAWITEQLQREHDKPFFLGCGIYKPHLPWYVPRKYYDLFPLEEVQLPDVLPDDLADIPDRGRDIAHRGGNYHKHVVEAGQWKKAVQGYLASMAFSDATVGRLLDALDDLQRVAQLDLTNATVEAIMEGVDLVERKFMRVLEDSGVEVIDPAGDPFNPETMEAMMRVPAESEEEDDQVDQVLQKGYALKGQLVRPARVSVRKKD